MFGPSTGLELLSDIVDTDERPLVTSQRVLRMNAKTDQATSLVFMWQYTDKQALAPHTNRRKAAKAIVLSTSLLSTDGNQR